MLSGPTVRWQVSSPVHECSDSAVSVGNWWSCWTSRQGKRCAVSSGSCGYQTQEPCTSVDTGHVWCSCGIYPTSVELVSWLCKWSGVMDEVRIGCPSTSNMYINDNNEMVWADRCISLKQFRAELALILSQPSVWDDVHECYHRTCSGSQQLNEQQNGCLIDQPPVLQSWMSCIITHGCTTDEDGIHGVEKFHLPAHKFMRIEGIRQIQNFGIVTGSFLLLHGAWCHIDGGCRPSSVTVP
jgi:hypothetical protein